MMGNSARLASVWLVVVATAGFDAAAQEPARTPPAAPAGSTAFAPDEGGGWTFTLAPYLWAAGLNGTAGLGRIDADVDASFGDILKDLNIGGMALVEARHDRLGFFANSLFIRTKADSSGAIDTKVTNDTTIIAAGVSYRVVDFDVGELVEGQPVTIGIEPYAGARWTHLRLEIELRQGNRPVPGHLPQADKSRDWVDPIVGTRVHVNFTDNWVLSGAADVGGFGVGTDVSWNAQGYVGYRDTLFGVPVVYNVGYRALYQNYDHDNFKWDVLQQGPILGTVFKF
jgi:hypothetical protein